jgi:hypothetical protein
VPSGETLSFEGASTRSCVAATLRFSFLAITVVFVFSRASVFSIRTSPFVHGRLRVIFFAIVVSHARMSLPNCSSLFSHLQLSNWIFFLPLDSSADKTEIANSSFANTVVKLRARTGRLDAALAAHASKCDAAYVALYATGDEPQGYRPGIVRFLNVEKAPPRRGRPNVDTTLSLSEMVHEIVAKATSIDSVTWADPEPDPSKR